MTLLVLAETQVSSQGATKYGGTQRYDHGLWWHDDAQPATAILSCSDPELCNRLTLFNFVCHIGVLSIVSVWSAAMVGEYGTAKAHSHTLC